MAEERMHSTNHSDDARDVLVLPDRFLPGGLQPDPFQLIGQTGPIVAFQDLVTAALSLRASLRRVLHHVDDSVGHVGRCVSHRNMFAALEMQSFDADPRGDYRQAAGQSFQNLQARSAADAQRDGQHPGRRDKRANVRNVGVEFHFFSHAANGLAKIYLQNVLLRFLSDRVVVYPQLPYDRYLESINRCDMFVNPFPFGNTNGIVDTVRQGLPGVCLTGAEVHSHIDEGLFKRLGLPEWLITHWPEQYVKAAVRLVNNSDEREELSRLIQQSDPDKILFHGNAALFADAVEWLHKTHARHSAEDVRVLRPPAKARRKRS